jgi:molybdopterin-containing oxidoreductase family iron-sulfur binding subunit
MSGDFKRHPEKGQTDEACASDLTRRGFLKGVGATAGLLAAGSIPALGTVLAQTAGAADEPASASGEATAGHEAEASHFAERNQSMNYPGKPVKYAPPAGDQSWAMVIDVNACVGCRRCVYACVRENNIARNGGFTYIQVLEMEKGSLELEHADLDYAEAGNPDHWYLPVQCMQCAKPTCVLGCPVKATWKEPDGIVVIDYDKCISCKNCLVTCPYEARHVNWLHPHIPESDVNDNVPYEEKAGVVEKCTFCIHRTRKGQTTACTEACPVGARTFGDLNDPESAVSKILRTKRVFRLKEELGNEPMIWYVG